MLKFVEQTVVLAAFDTFQTYVTTGILVLNNMYLTDTVNLSRWIHMFWYTEKFVQPARKKVSNDSISLASMFLYGGINDSRHISRSSYQ